MFETEGIERSHILFLTVVSAISSTHRYDAKADLWSVGTVLFEMIAGRPPFNGENHIELLRNIQRKAVRLPPDVRVSKPCVNLLRLLLNRNPLSRAGFKEFFEACDAFCALGCEGLATHEVGTCRIPVQQDLGTIHEHDVGTSSSHSESLMTVATNAHPQQHQRPGTSAVGARILPNLSVPPPFDPLSTPTSLLPNLPGAGDMTQAGARQYPSRLQPLEHSPPSAPVPEPQALNSRIPVLPSLSSNPQQKQPWQQTYSTDLYQSGRNNEVSQYSQGGASTDESGFVMVEYGANNNSYAAAQQQATNSPGGTAIISATGDNQVYNRIPDNRGPTRLVPSPPSSGPYYVNTTPSAVPPLVSARGDYMVVNDRRMPPKGMLSTSPGTGGFLMGLVNRAAPRLTGNFVSAPSGNNSNTASPNSNRLEAQIAAATKMIAAAEDLGRRAISVAHLGDSRAYLAMRLVFMCVEGSSLLSATPMEGVDEESKEGSSGHGEALTDDSSSTELMAPTRRRSSTHSMMDRVMTDAKIDENQAEEMPFAISPDAPAVALPSRTSLSVYGGSKNPSGSMASNKPMTKPSPAFIRSRFGEALSCYLKALKMLQGAVGAAQRVTKEIESLSTMHQQPLTGHNPIPFDFPQMLKRCEVTSNWLCGQFRGVLERADAATVEISKLPSSQTLPNASVAKDDITPALPVSSVEELIYSHSLASGRDGAVKQLLGQYEAARSCYRSAGLLAETLLMEVNIGAEDRKILEGYVDGFAARITELDELMLQQSRMIGSSHTGGMASSTQVGRRGSSVIGLIGPPPSAPGFLVSPR
jgi:hypothetical protein